MMICETEKIALRRTALITGVTMIIMALLAAFAVGVVENKLIIIGNAAATMNNLKIPNYYFKLEFSVGSLFSFVIL